MHSGLTERKVGKSGRFMEPLLGWPGVGRVWMGLSGGCERARVLGGWWQRRSQGSILFGEHSVLGVKGETHLKLQPSHNEGSTSDATALTWNSSGFPPQLHGPGNHQGASGRKANKKAASGPRDSKRRKGKCNSALLYPPCSESL